MLNWAQFVKFDLAPYPAVAAYRDRLRVRPAVAPSTPALFASLGGRSPFPVNGEGKALA